MPTTWRVRGVLSGAAMRRRTDRRRREDRLNPRPDDSTNSTSRKDAATRLAARGLSNKAIAIELAASESTVSRWLRRVTTDDGAQIAQGLARFTTLTPAERHAAALAARGRTNEAIAEI